MLAYRKTAEENQRQAGRAEKSGFTETELEERFEQEQEMFRQEIRKQRFADQEEYREAKKMDRRLEADERSSKRRMKVWSFKKKKQC